MRLYETEYPQYTTEFRTYFWANSLKEAQELVRIRGLNEDVLGSRVVKPRKSAWTINLTNPHNPEIAHSLIFVGFVALKAGLLPEKVFGDLGVIHEMLHQVNTYKFDKEVKGQVTTDIRNYWNVCEYLGFLPAGIDFEKWMRICNKVGNREA